VTWMMESSMCAAPVSNCMHINDQFGLVLINHPVVESAFTVAVHVACPVSLTVHHQQSRLETVLKQRASCWLSIKTQWYVFRCFSLSNRIKNQRYQCYKQCKQCVAFEAFADKFCEIRTSCFNSFGANVDKSRHSFVALCSKGLYIHIQHWEQNKKNYSAPKELNS